MQCSHTITDAQIGLIAGIIFIGVCCILTTLLLAWCQFRHQCQRQQQNNADPRPGEYRALDDNHVDDEERLEEEENEEEEVDNQDHDIEMHRPNNIIRQDVNEEEQPAEHVHVVDEDDLVAGEGEPHANGLQ